MFGALNTSATRAPEVTVSELLATASFSTDLVKKGQYHIIKIMKITLLLSCCQVSEHLQCINWSGV